MPQPALLQHMSGLLKLAVVSGSTTSVRRNLSHAAHPDVSDSQGRTALMIAAARGSSEICALLLDVGADPCLVDAAGDTALSHAIRSGDAECIRLLTSFTGGHIDGGHSSPEDGVSDGDSWEAEEEQVLSLGDASVTERAADIQVQLGRYAPVPVGEDWSDVVIEVPPPPADPRRTQARTRRTVRFRRNKRGEAQTIGQLPFELDGSADDVLSRLTLGELVRGSDGSKELIWAMRGLPEAELTAMDFLCDADAEAQFTQSGLSLADFFELCDIVNAFTVLLHRLRQGSGQAMSRPLKAEAAPALQARTTPGPALDPATELSNTTLARIILNSAASGDLRKAMGKTHLASMTAEAFLQEDEAEKVFDGVLSVKQLLELTDLVNAYATVIFHERRRT